MSDKEKRSAALIRAYALERHPEGGWFSEVFTAAEGGERKLAGSIYFLLDRDDISHFHQIDCEELWYFHEGCGLNCNPVTYTSFEKVSGKIFLTSLMISVTFKETAPRGMLFPIELGGKT